MDVALRRILCLGTVLCVMAALADAQPLPDLQPPESRGAPGGNSKIPVTVPDTETLGAEMAAVSSGPSTVSLEQPIDPATYICGPGDVFDLNFWGQQNFRLRIAVDVEGRTFISKVGFVRAAGKTLAAVRDEVKKKLRGTYPGLQADLILVSPRSFIVHLVSNVKQPGSYAATPLERVSTIIARAGGVTGSRRKISIRHRDGSTTVADLVKYELQGDLTLNPFVLDGDVITVPTPGTMVSISGAVHRPGTYELTNTGDLTELLSLAGGLTNSVTTSLPIRIIRNDEKQHASYVNVAFANASPGNTTLQDLDSVLVPTQAELQRSVLLVGAVANTEAVDEAAATTRLQYIEGDTVRSLIERAGGIRAPGDLRRSYISRQRETGPPELIAIDLEALLVRRDFSADKPIAMSDTIVVPPMQRSVLVEGAVARPGLYLHNPAFGVDEYIARAGGRTRTARGLDDVKRIDADGKTQSYSSALRVYPGDAILVPERDFTRAEVVQLVLAGAGLILSGVTVAFLVTQ